ncbi:MAG: protein-disulfide isomerase [Parcubacteria group bacterium Gr01-1014_29]|nr:MAG: protein-disulfide isomerase [Parcubacteria group bacterium Gr01-1014_29]
MEEDTQPQQQQETASEHSISKKERRELRREERKAAGTREQKSKSFRRLMLWLIAILLVGGSLAGVFYLAKTAKPVENNQNGSGLRDAVSSEDWVGGNPDAAVTLVEYADFQCPACGQYHPIIKKLEEELGAQVRFVFRHFPLARIHPNAEAAAAAAEAAGLQGKFWEMRTILFERQNDWSKKPNPRTAFVAYAQELGLTTDQFENDMELDAIEEKIKTQLNGGTASGVNSTPTFFINGAKIDNPRSLDEFRNMLTQAIAAAPPLENTGSAGDAKTPETSVEPNDTNANAPQVNL